MFNKANWTTENIVIGLVMMVLLLWGLTLWIVKGLYRLALYMVVNGVPLIMPVLKALWEQVQMGWLLVIGALEVILVRVKTLYARINLNVGGAHGTGDILLVNKVKSTLINDRWDLDKNGKRLVGIALRARELRLGLK